MLSAIRQKLRFWGLMILLILVGIPLVFMGLGNYQTPQKDYSAIINDQVVSQARLEQEIFQYKQALKRNYQGNIPPIYTCLLYTSPSPRDQRGSRMPSSA